VRGLRAPLVLVAARARRRPTRWLLPAIGIAVAVAFAGGVAAEGVIAGDQAARSVLGDLSPVDRTVAVTWQGPLTPAASRQADQVLRRLGLGAPTEVVLLRPVRLNEGVVRPAAIAPLGHWLAGGAPSRLGPCRAASCPMLLADTGSVPPTLTASGVRIPVRGDATLRSAAPLGFSPTSAGGPPVLITGDATGLESLAGLGGVDRTHSWLAPLAAARLHSWQLAGVEAQLHRAQAAVTARGSQLSITAPFAGLDEARAQASAAPRRLLLAGGGAIAALALFVVLAAGGLRRDQLAELGRLRNAGGLSRHAVLFVAGESAWVSGAALILGAGLAIVAAAILAGAAGEPVGGVLTNSLITPVAALALAGAWLATTAAMTLAVLARGARVIDLLAIAAIAAVAVAVGLTPSGNDPLALLLLPLCCLAAAVLTFRAAAVLLRAGERLSRRGPVLGRLALVGLARAPSLPSLAIAFIAVSIGLGGFALAYRATLVRGAADQAADRVPLDATVSPGADFKTPLQVAAPARWRSIAAGAVLPVRRTEANYASGAATTTVPALGIPARGLPLIHGWRTSDGSAPLASLAARLRPPGPVRVPGPVLPASAQSLSLRASSPAIAVAVTADLRDRRGVIHQLALGTAGPHPAALRVRVPPGRWELEALELHEPSGLEITSGHQNGENEAAMTQSNTRVVLSPLRVLPGAGRAPIAVGMGDWRAVGAASAARPEGAGDAVLRFSASGAPGLLRPAQPSDARPVPVLVDPGTAGYSGAGGRIALSVDGLPVSARVVGVLQRFPTLATDAAGFVVADEATLASALDAQRPGAGRPDELWMATTRTARLRAALERGPLSQLNSSFRADVEHRLLAAPVARAVLGTLIAATVLSGALAVLGLLLAMFGAARDERIERDLEAQGIGPRALRTEARVRVVLTSVAGVGVGLGIAVLLTRLAVASVRAAGTVAAPRPPLVTVVPWIGLGALGVAAIVVLAGAGWIATRSLIRTGPARPAATTRRTERRGSLDEGVAQ
jgi:hypothetical protein